MIEGIPDKTSGNDLAARSMVSVSKLVIDQAVECKGSRKPPFAVTTMEVSSSIAPFSVLEKPVLGKFPVNRIKKKDVWKHKEFTFQKSYKNRS
tara:strand:- start:234 stop:512 length:279 start_codon:yes stop_codon:yes gene_type:complete